MDALISVNVVFNDSTYTINDLRNSSRISAIRDKLGERAGLKKVHFKLIQLTDASGEKLGNTAINNSKSKANDTIFVKLSNNPESPMTLN